MSALIETNMGRITSILQGPLRILLVHLARILPYSRDAYLTRSLNNLPRDHRIPRALGKCSSGGYNTEDLRDFSSSRIREIPRLCT